MTVRKYRGLVLSILAVAVLAALGSHDLVAADVPSGEGQLTPIPANADAASQPGASPFREEASAGPVASADEGDCAEFCGLQVCSPPGRFWLRADYLMWWTSGMKLPSLVSTDVLGAGTILYGNSTVNDGGRSGFRTTVGMWLDACRVWDVEFDYLLLPEQSSSYISPFPSGNQIIMRPFFNVQTNQPAGELVAFPNQVEGTVSVSAKDYFQSAGVSLSYNLCSGNSCSAPCDPCDNPCAEACGPPLLNCCRTDLLVGFRYYNLSDNVTINEDLRLLQDIRGITGTRIQVHDSFSGRNDFYGSEIGLRTQIYRGRWSLEVLTKVAVGNNHETVVIDGQTIVTPPLQPAQPPSNAGVFAGPTNSGTYQRDVFTMIPQLGLELGRQMNCHWRAYVGYNILYWGSVVRGGDQIDLNLDPRNFPPAQAGALPFPAFPGRTSAFWAHGVNVGTEFRF
jgi:hypothetical protein